MGAKKKKAKKVKAKAGDTLCGIAAKAGFLNCDPVRNDPANAKLVKELDSRELQPGDVVVVPAKRKKKASGKKTKASHKSERKGVPIPQIRFVHGSPDQPYSKDDALDHLNVSNYVTNQAGANGTAAFSAAYGFDADAHADPDTFKVEVADAGAGATVDVLLEALQPKYDAAGKVTGHDVFKGAEYAPRKTDLVLEKTSASAKRYRTRYLRLVTDSVDAGAPAQPQTLLVTDMADGKAGAADQVEILDQRVRATYVVQRCKRSKKCRVVVEQPIGPRRQRIKLALHVFRKKAGKPAAVGGVTEENVRRRAMKWFRRAYAQAELSPKLVAPEFQLLDPPEANMLVVSQDHGRLASGRDGSGDSSEIEFVLGSPPPDIDVPVIREIVHLGHLIVSIFDDTVKVTLTRNMTPARVGQAIVRALPNGYSGTAFTNARAFNAANGSCDVMVTKDDGERVMIRGEACSDTRATLHVARVNLDRVQSTGSPGAAVIPTTMQFRRVLRSVAGTDDRLDCYVVGGFSSAGLRGRAFVPATDLAAGFRPPVGVRWAAIMGTTSSSGAVMDGGDNLPFTFPHEAGHVLNDGFHTTRGDPLERTEMMSGRGTSAANAVNATKRISDTVQVSYDMFDPAQASPGDAHSDPIDAVTRFRTRGGPVLEGW